MKKGSMNRVKIAVKKEPADSAEDGVYMTATPHGLRYGTEKSVQQRYGSQLMLLLSPDSETMFAVAP